MSCNYFPFLLQSQSTEEKLEKMLEEAKVLETCAILQCERLYIEIIKKAKEELGAGCGPVTTKVSWATISDFHITHNAFGFPHKILHKLLSSILKCI